MKFLITAGGTAEPIDAVRVLSNLSTGHTGAQLAKQLAGRGHQVILLRSVRAEPAQHAGVCEVLFDTFESLDRALQNILAAEKIDWIIQAAAVSDYRVSGIEIEGKIYSSVPAKLPSGRALCLHLSPTYKIIDRLPTYARENRPGIIGFKLTAQATALQAQQAAARVRADWVVQNDTADLRAGKRIFTLYQQGQKNLCLDGIPALADWIDGLSVKAN